MNFEPCMTAYSLHDLLISIILSSFPPCLVFQLSSRVETALLSSCLSLGFCWPLCKDVAVVVPIYLASPACVRALWQDCQAQQRQSVLLQGLPSRPCGSQLI